MKTRTFAFLHSFAALAAGLFIYLLLREGTFLHLTFRATGVFAAVRFWGDDFIRYYFPDFLWGYALAMGLYGLYPPKGEKGDTFPAVAAAAVGLAYEVMQASGRFSGTGDPADVWLYLYAAFAAYKIISLKKERDSMKKALTLALAILMIATFTVFALGSGSSEESDQGKGDTAATKAPEVDECTVEIQSCRLAEDYEGKPVVIVKYAFTNNDTEEKSFYLSFDDKVYQNGIGLNESYILDDSADYSSDNQTKAIKQGATLEVEVAYALNDTTTDIEVELSALFSFSDTKVTKTFPIA